jgi:hypothetical protein
MKLSLSFLNYCCKSRGLETVSALIIDVSELDCATKAAIHFVIFNHTEMPAPENVILVKVKGGVQIDTSLTLDNVFKGNEGELSALINRCSQTSVIPIVAYTITY